MRIQLIIKYSVIMALCFAVFVIGGFYHLTGINTDNEILVALGENIITFSLSVSGFCTLLMVILEEVIGKQRNYFKRK